MVAIKVGVTDGRIPTMVTGWLRYAERLTNLIDWIDLINCIDWIGLISRSNLISWMFSCRVDALI